MTDVSILPDDPLWYKDAIIYEVHVKTFCDGNGDGNRGLQGNDLESWTTSKVSGSIRYGCSPSILRP